MITPGHLVLASLLGASLVILGTFLGAGMVCWITRGMPVPDISRWGRRSRTQDASGNPAETPDFRPPSMEAADPPPPGAWTSDIGPAYGLPDRAVLDAWEETKREVAEGTLDRDWLNV